MKTVTGNLLDMAWDGEFDVIVHGCNCFHTMGAGVAAQIADRWPEVLEADKKNTDYGSPWKLGSFSAEKVFRPDGSYFIVVNAYTQFGCGPGKQVEYAAVRGAFEKVLANFRGRRIGYPQIGAGLAGGDWTIIEEIIDGILGENDHTLVLWGGGK